MDIKKPAKAGFVCYDTLLKRRYPEHKPLPAGKDAEYLVNVLANIMGILTKDHKYKQMVYDMDNAGV